MKKLNPFILSLIAAAIFTSPTPAHAYIGPGAGLGAIAVTIALLLGVLLLVVGLVWYPLKRLLKGKKNNPETSSSVDGTE